MFSSTKLQRHRYVVFLYIVIAIVMTWPLLVNLNKLPFEATMDTFLFSWSFWWIQYAIVNGVNPLVSSMLFYPLEANLALATLSIPYALIAQPFMFLLGNDLGIPVAFNFVIIMSFVLTAYFSYLLALEIGIDVKSAFFVGLFYSFSAIHFENLSRFHLLCLELIPVIILCLLKIFSVTGGEWKKGIRYGVLLGVLVALLAYMSQTFSIHIVVIISVFTLAITVRHKFRNVNILLFSCLFVGVVVFFLITYPLIFHVSEMFQSHVVQKNPMLNPDVLRVIRPNLHLVFYDWLNRLIPIQPFALNHNHNFPGYLPYFFSFLGFRYFKPPKKFGGRWPWISLFVIGLLLAPGTQLRIANHVTSIKMPLYYIYQVVSWLQADRAPDRYYNLVILVLSFPSGIGLAKFLEGIERKNSLHPKLKKIMPLLVVSVFLLEQKWKPMRYLSQDKILLPQLDRLGEVLEKDANVVLSLPENVDEKHTFYLQQRTGVRVLVADYARVSRIYRYKILKDTGIFKYFQYPESFVRMSVKEQGKVCEKIRKVFRQYKIHVAYTAPAPPHILSRKPKFINTHKLMRSCSDLVFVPPVEKAKKYMVPAILYIFVGDADGMKEKFLKYWKSVETTKRTK